MTRRMDIEVTSTRPDGSFTWRQAGARAPKGSGPAEVLPSGAKIGDVLRADIEMDMDGPVILGLSPIKQRERNVTLLAITGSGAAFTPVTEVSTNRRTKRDGRSKDGKGPRGDKRGPGRGPRPEAGTKATPALRVVNLRLPRRSYRSVLVPLVCVRSMCIVKPCSKR